MFASRLLFAVICATLLSCSASSNGLRNSPVITTTPAKQYDAQVINAWVTETLTLLESEAFHENLRGLKERCPTVWVSPNIQGQSLEYVSDALRLNNSQQTDLRWAPVEIEVAGYAIKKSNYTSGHVGITTAITDWSGRIDNGLSVAKISLGGVHFLRYDQGSLVEKSCAINTMAHEISHTLSNHASEFRIFFQDTGNSSGRPSGTPNATYLIGSVAQCTWLQNKGRVSEDDFSDCVATFKAQPFPQDACNNFDNPNQTIAIQ